MNGLIAISNRYLQSVATFALLFCLALPPAQASDVDPRSDEQLRQRLIAAMATGDGFEDRFDAEVWLVDMAGRLSTILPSRKERLELLRTVHHEARRVDLKPELVLAVIEVESRFDRFAISRSGAQGLMQIMPFWLATIGHPDDNLFDLQTNLRFGCTILRYYLDKENGNVQNALARYNGSFGSSRYPSKVFRALRENWAGS